VRVLEYIGERSLRWRDVPDARVVEPTDAVEIGDEVTAPEVGDLVVVPWHISCGTCASCAGKTPSRCLSIQALA